MRRRPRIRGVLPVDPVNERLDGPRHRHVHALQGVCLRLHDRAHPTFVAQEPEVLTDLHEGPRGNAAVLPGHLRKDGVLRDVLVGPDNVRERVDRPLLATDECGLVELGDTPQAVARPGVDLVGLVNAVALQRRADPAGVGDPDGVHVLGATAGVHGEQAILEVEALKGRRDGLLAGVRGRQREPALVHVPHVDGVVVGPAQHHHAIVRLNEVHRLFKAGAHRHRHHRAP